jgi:serine/threonine-protein kinase RsbW
MPEPRRAPPSAAAVLRAAGALDDFCAAERLPADVVWKLRVALDEILANIVSHGHSAGGVPDIQVTFRRDGAEVQVTVVDDGQAFDPLARPDPDVTLPLDTRKPGGVGIVLVKSLMDELRYERTTRNVLTLTKRIVPDGDSGDSR